MEEVLHRRVCCRHAVNNHDDDDLITYDLLTMQVNDKFDSGIELGQGEESLNFPDHNKTQDNSLQRIHDYKSIGKEKQANKIVQTDPVTILDPSFIKDLINNNNFINASVQATEDNPLRGHQVFWRYFWYTVQAIFILMFVSNYHTSVHGFCEYLGKSALLRSVAEFLTPKKIENESYHTLIMSFLKEATDNITFYLKKVVHPLEFSRLTDVIKKLFFAAMN